MPTAPDLKAFTGTLPYATELFGVYQPLLGWKARLAKKRVDQEGTIFLIGLVGQMADDPDVEHAYQLAPGPLGPGSEVTRLLPAGLGMRVATEVQRVAQTFWREKGREPEGDEWESIIRSVTDLATPGDSSSPLREAVTTGVLGYTSHAAPDLLNAMFLRDKPDWAISPDHFDPLANFDPRIREAVLSPIGIVQTYREYFFEMKTFLGPPVGHVWISPGGSVELFETHTRRTVQERQLEFSTETVQRTESGSTSQDELATAVGEQNIRNAQLGISASGGANFGVFQASATASMAFNTTHTTSEQTAHKRAREQSEKLSEEIRRSFKTVFRTSVEVQDTSSIRHVLQNTTNKLVNYELRRKMRMVGVQLQHVGTQLCWQVYVDEPGTALGVSELVHVANPDDLVAASIQPPDASFILPKVERFVPLRTFTVPEAGSGHFMMSPVTVKEPSPGYSLDEKGVQLLSVKRCDNGQEEIDTAGLSLTRSSPTTFTLSKNSWDHDLVALVKLTWNPPDQTAALAEYNKKLADYTVQKRQAAHTDYVKAVRERVKLASGITLRSDRDLRAEERTVVFRSLIHRLTKLPASVSPHVTSELIRAMFDVEQMLYFVAPDWWAPRLRYAQDVGSSGETTLTDEDRVGWGGVGALWRSNYLITEDAQPARMGASLGWLLQLDGDEHRNAFLNSPWVKAVVPIRPGFEKAALHWLQLAHIEDADGLDAPYVGPGVEPGTTVRDALLELASSIGAANIDPKNLLATETVFDKGFDPLEGGFRATGELFELFDQWLEILPTDQIVAVEYDAKL